MMVVLLGTMSWVLAMLLAAAPANCALSSGNVTQQLALAYEQFDSAEGSKSWRQLAGSGCADAAVELLRRYDEVNASRLTAGQRSELAFHQGQVLAFADRNAEALRHLDRALAIGGDEEWTTYLAATIAFLRRDRRELEEARKRYARIAPGSMREKLLAGLAACPTRPYMAAAHCAM